MRRSIVLVGTALAISSPATAGAAAVHCGDTVTQNVKLTRDLPLAECTGATGLGVGADNIVIDLNGHRIETDPTAGSDRVGIRLNGHRGVIVRNGSVLQWPIGLLVDGNDNKIQKVGAGGGGFGMWIDGSRNLVENSSQGGNNFTGLRVGGADNVIAYNTTTFAPDPRERFDFSIGAVDFYGPHNTLRDSRVVGEDGVQLHATSRSVVVRNKLVTTDSGDPQHPPRPTFIRDAGGSDSEISANAFTGGGVILESLRAVVNGNRVTGGGFEVNAGGGHLIIANRSEFFDGIGFALNGVNGATLRDNIAGSERSQSGGKGGDGAGIVVRDSSNAVVLDHNNANFNAASGISIQGAANTTVSRNITNFNGGDGIFDAGDGGTVSQNEAQRNQGYGIEVAASVADGGRNKAFGNLLGQCVNVVCK